MISSKFTENGPANSGTGLPSSDKQQPVKTALRDLQNNNRIMAPKSTGKPPLVKDRVPVTGEALVSGVKRPATECLQKPKSNQAPTSSGTNGPLVYARRKCEQDLQPKTNEFSKDKKTDCAQVVQQEKGKPQQQAQSESTEKSSISTISTTSGTVTLPPGSKEFEKDKKRAREDQQEKDKPQQQGQSESTKKSCISALSATSAVVTLLPESKELEKDKKRAQEDHQEKDKPQPQAQSESTEKSSLSPISATSPTVTLPPKSNEPEKDKRHAQEDRQEKFKPQQQAQSESTKKSSLSPILATSPTVTLPPKRNELEKDKKLAQEDPQEKYKPQQQAQSESTEKSSLSPILATSPTVTLPPKRDELEKDKKLAQEDQQEKYKPQQQAQSESTEKSSLPSISATSLMVTLPPKCNELEKEKSNDSAQKDQQDQGKPQQQVQSESTKEACVSAVSAICPTVTLPPKSNEFGKERDTNSAQKDQLEQGKSQRQTQSESTKKDCVSAIPATSPMVTLPPKSKEFEKEKDIDSAQKGQHEEVKPQQEAQSESTKKAGVSDISATSPMVTLPPKSNQFEKDKDIDSAQKVQQEQGKPQRQAQIDSTKKTSLPAISAPSPVVTSGGSSSFPVKPLNENSSEQNSGTNMSEISHSGKSDGVNDQHWRERFVQLQAHLRSCDQSRNLETIKKLQTLTPVGRSKYAVELEKRAIQLLLEEGNELMRMKELNVLGKPVAKSSAPTNSAPPWTKQLQSEN